LIGATRYAFLRALPDKSMYTVAQSSTRGFSVMRVSGRSLAKRHRIDGISVNQVVIALGSGISKIEERYSL
jgi:hypothetical protein